VKRERFHKRPAAPFFQMPVLAATARYAGDEIVAVAAVDEETAEEALELIRIDYQVLPFVLDAEAAVKPTAPQLYPRGTWSRRQSIPSYGATLKRGFGRRMWSWRRNTKPI